ncbi:hypothetical protein Rhopal_003591-T1 [Rhodotorula paludigena]|uniref:Mitochondrial outer membrane protein IML2 n=1 Tax=Rhodotorula paludigena TaxID=86838 RepID=A0AAV5GJH5_9BASI|nr:hypothetical protein Rhopal_003591-T1 [Rhodotorula paludigena]
MTSRTTVLAQIEDATKGFEGLLDNDLDIAMQILRAKPDSAFHLVGLGIAAFLKAILSREDAELREAQANTKRPRGDTAGAYPAGTEFKLLNGDAVIGQALVAIMSESYVEFAKAIWKLNKAYKIFMSIQKTVFPNGVEEDESLDSVFRKLNENYLAQTTKPAESSLSSSGGGGFFGWGRKKATPASTPLRHAASSAALSSSAGTLPAAGAASAPGSHMPSRPESVSELADGLDGKFTLAGEEVAANATDDPDAHPQPLWAGDALTTLVISGAALGSGMFGLIFSMLPPKMRKAISWFGFSNSNRPIALKLLTVASATGDDVHGFFASLTLLTFYGFILLMSGWQASEPHYLRSMSRILSRVHTKFPHGTLWVLNRAKLARYERRSDDAIAIIEKALVEEKKAGNTFREADSLLVFELSWLYLSQARFVDTANSFERMCDYIAIAAGALIDALNTQRLAGETLSPDLVTRVEALCDRLPSLCQQKRVFGEKPVTETFIVRRGDANKAKLDRWIQKGRVKPDAKVWEVVRISNALELGLFWATVGGRSPASGVQKQIDLLSSFTPLPRFRPTASSPSASASASPANLSRTSSRTPSTLSRRGTNLSSSSSAPSVPLIVSPSDELDTPSEVLIRDLLLGVLYASLSHSDPARLRIAAAFLDAILAATPEQVGDEKWVPAFAGWHRAVVELKSGDLEMRERGVDEGKKTEEAKKIWRDRFRRAETWLDAVLALGEYDLKTRLESRVLMLRDEIATKKRRLGLA